MRFIGFVFLHLFVFLILIASYSYAEDKIFTCKPVMASVQLKNGEYYFETLDDENTPLIDNLTVSQFLIVNDDVFYKNNKKRKFEKLISSKHFSGSELNSENVFKKIWNIFAEWDQMLDLKNFITFIYPYRSYNINGDYDLSMKRISIHKENYKTSEITVPITEDRPSYFIERSCEGEKETDVIQHFFEKSKNRKLS
jgi:predicted nucleic acid-binding protein